MQTYPVKLFILTLGLNHYLGAGLETLVDCLNFTVGAGLTVSLDLYTQF